MILFGKDRSDDDLTLRELRAAADKYRRLADDLESLALRRGLTKEQLEWSPHLDRFVLGTREVECLVGEVSGTLSSQEWVGCPH